MARALVTGAGKRLGRAMALELARRGLDVAVHYATSREDALGLVAEIKALGRNAVAIEADLLDEAQTETLVDRAAEAMGGPLSVLINNASIFEYDTIATATRESWDRHMESNLRAPFVLTQALAKGVPAPQQDDAGEPVIDSGISVGPAHALAPFDCDGVLAFLVEPRVRGAESVPAPRSLVDRELRPTGANLQRANCVPLSLSLP